MDGHQFEKEVVEAYVGASGWSETNATLSHCLNLMGSRGFGARLVASGVDVRPLARLFGVSRGVFPKLQLSHPDALIAVGPSGSYITIIEAKTGRVRQPDLIQLVRSLELMSLVVEVLNDPKKRISVFGSTANGLPHLEFDSTYPGSIRLVHPLSLRPDHLGGDASKRKPFYNIISPEVLRDGTEDAGNVIIHRYPWPRGLREPREKAGVSFVVDYFNSDGGMGVVYAPYEMGAFSRGVEESIVPLELLFR